MKSTLKQFWTSQKWTSLLKTFSQIGELITHQKNKKLKEIQLQRDQNKAFIAYEKISKTIESILHEEQIEMCNNMIVEFYQRTHHLDLMIKLLRELQIKTKSLNSTFH